VADAYESPQASNADIRLSVPQAVGLTAKSGRGTGHLLEKDVIKPEA
jgi:hypothetical protein